MNKNKKSKKEEQKELKKADTIILKDFTHNGVSHVKCKMM